MEKGTAQADGAEGCVQIARRRAVSAGCCAAVLAIPPVLVASTILGHPVHCSVQQANCPTQPMWPVWLLAGIAAVQVVGAFAAASSAASGEHGLAASRARAAGAWLLLAALMAGVPSVALVAWGLYVMANANNPNVGCAAAFAPAVAMVGGIGLVYTLLTVVLSRVLAGVARRLGTTARQ